MFSTPAEFLTPRRAARILPVFGLDAQAWTDRHARPNRARSSVVEQLAFNQLVVGSIPTGLTKNCQSCLVVSIHSIRVAKPVRTRKRRECEAHE
jgi:hypothetical protein